MKRTTHFLKLFLALAMVIVCVIFSSPVHAQNVPADNFGLQSVGDTITISTQTTDIRVTIVRIINIFLGFLGLVAVLIVLYGGYLYMTSRGDEEQVGTAKKWLVNGVIGLAIILSAYALTSFIISKLTDAINNGNENGGGGVDPILDCSQYSDQCTFNEYFVVKSITPHTLAAQETQMNNMVIRVLFSKQVAGTPGSIFKIYKKETGEEVTAKFDFAFEEGGVLVTARYNDGSICDDRQGIDLKCLPYGEYEIKVNPSVKDVSGKSLTTEVSSRSFPLQATFKTGDAPILDDLFDSLDPVSINGNSGDEVYALVQGQEYPIKTRLRDHRGNSYAYVRVYEEGASGTIIEEYLDGPRIVNGSTDSFELIYGLLVKSGKFPSGHVYVVEVVAHDIDGNTKTDTVKFGTVPATCSNGIQDNGETGVDQGGPCGIGAGGSCRSQKDCAVSLKCLDAMNKECTGSGSCMCKPVPYISSVEVMNGAPGNWITIAGKNFGSIAGSIKFGYDFNVDGIVDSSVLASLAQCKEGSVWNDSWIIAEVPPQAEVLNQNPFVAVSPLEIIGGIKNNSGLRGASSVSVSGDYAYVTGQQAGFLNIIKISDLALPELVSTISIPGVFYVHAVGNYAYAVNNGSFFVVNVTNKSVPVIEGSIINSQLMGGSRGIFVSGNYAYVASEGSNTVAIIDISNKKVPVIVGSVGGADFDGARNIAVSGQYAYVTNYRNNSLRVIDISNPVAPVVVGGIKDDFQLLHISGLAVSGQYAYVSVFDKNSIVVFDISNPSLPRSVGSVQDNQNLAGAFSISLSGNKLFVANRRGNGVSVVYVSDPTHPQVAGILNNSSDLSQIFAIAAAGSYGYTANFSDNSFRIIDATNVGITPANNPAISVIASSGQTDSTNDNFGPNLGTFTYTNTKRPGLCSVTVESDRTITRDDGTQVVIHAGDQSAPQGTQVSLMGKAFGNNQGKGTALFGAFNSSPSSWSEELITSAVPFGGTGLVTVNVLSDTNEKSNPVPFTITTLSDLYPPIITSIDPPSTTKGSYITISGTHFGNAGTVYFTKTEGNSCPGAGCSLASSLPASCGTAWTDTQIIAKVPVDQEFTLGKYFVIVRRGDGVNTLASSGKENIEVVTGDPRPSVCKITPSRGFAPNSNSDALIISGENFSADPKIRFWYPLAQPQNITTWLSTVGDTSFSFVGPLKIITGIPYDSNSGLSMSSGPIKVQNKSNDPNSVSNGVRYEVLDCREPSSPQLAGFQCCTEGPDAGRWKQGNFACQGSSREAGYMWRFTTGKIPKKFMVVESCSATDLPSPSPSTLWQDGKNICLNAQLQVKFNLPVDENTVFVQNGNQKDLKNISITTCGGNATDIDCNQNVSSVTGDFTGEVAGGDTLILSRKDVANLLPNTWYRVAFSPDVASLRSDIELGVSVTRSEKIQPTKPCNSTSAYCFDFRTGPSDFMCTLIGAGIHPSDYTTHLLGIVQDPRYQPIFDINRVFDISAVKPFSYIVYGKSNLACTSINVDNKPWTWGPLTSDSLLTATAKHLDTYPNSYGYATAWQNNLIGSQIYAKISEGTSEIVATSTLIIDLGNPYAKNVWPSCLEACVNAEIGVEFSQQMITEDYNASNITLRKCADENCAETGLGPTISLDIKPESQSETIFRVYPSQTLLKNEWYLVDMGKGIHSIGGISGAGQSQVIKSGTTAIPRQWKFKTKNSDQLCLADSVHVLPDPFVSTFIGQAQLYKAFPVGSPDSCSPLGQQLNPWDYAWNWGVRDAGVAEVTDFSFGGAPKSTCTIGCTPKGSNIASSTYAGIYPVCGDGKVSSGEDCDIAKAGEIPGKSCTFGCLRPGNFDKNTCGNGTVETNLGEECDPKLSDSNSKVVPGFCTDTCMNAGSSVEQTGDPKIPVCGSGTVTYGEDCDTKDPATQNNCSKQCLNLGAQLSQVWCDGWEIRTTAEGNPGLYTSITQDDINRVCGTAVSVCGNRIVEQGEECDPKPGDPNPGSCSDRCLVQNACGTQYAQCVAGTEGCLSDCTFAGSSITYSTPSVCGDGKSGIGEYSGTLSNHSVLDAVHSCELPLGQVQNSLGQNPVQVVTSVGGTKGGQSVEVVSDMETRITAETAIARSGETGTLVEITPISGSGEYHLQCGYTEYTAPQDGSYNNCPINSGNVYGVGLNSCCMRRPERVSNYPRANAGTGTSAPVCRNTYLEVTFDQNIPIQYVQNNIQLIQSYPVGDSCAKHGGTTSTLISMIDIEPHHNFFARVWIVVKNFFIRLVHARVFAEVFPVPLEENINVPGGVIWCASNDPFEVKTAYTTSVDNQITQTIVSIYPTKVFDPDQYVIVILNGGKDGIKNTAGVSIKSPFGSELSDYWVFVTGADVCKIKDVIVDPVSSLYTTPNSSKDFVAHAVSTNHDQLIVSMPNQYEWTWHWGPQNDVTFDIPSFNTPNVSIASKGVRGHTDGVVEARVIKDIFESNNQTGKTFSAGLSLDALFCQQPWPASGVTLSENVASTTAVFEDQKYNFSMYYCADSGTTSVLDDLPYFKTIDVITDPQELGLISTGDLPQALRRYLMFADKTEDAIGLQIFANPTKPDGSRQTLEEWYVDKFGDLGVVKKASISGYDALTNEFNVYVNAFNVDLNSIYNNVYLFSIDTNATPETKTVFQQLINSLRFNTNITNFGRCLREEMPGYPPFTARETPTAITSINCTTDFDCRESDGKPKAGTNGFCSNAATKFNRDITRLEQMHTAQARTDSYFTNNQNTQNFQLNLSSGTYIPGYTNSKWPSWGKLGSLIGGAPIDPVNTWAGCDGQDSGTCWNVASTTYKCPVFAQTYEYSFVTSTPSTPASYKYYAPFEFVRSTDVGFVSQYIDTDHVKFDRWCTPASTISPFGGQCGDGNINVGEECDPPGRTTVYDNLCPVGKFAVATCNSACKFDYGSCEVSQGVRCGNGIFEPENNEQCDAGAQNGKYGSRCTATAEDDFGCSIGGQYCGNGGLDKDFTKTPPIPLEFCESADAKFQPGFCDLDRGREKITEGCMKDDDCKKPRIESVPSVCTYRSVDRTYYCSGYAVNDFDCSQANVDVQCRDRLGNPLFYNKTEYDYYGSCVSAKDSEYDIKKENSCSWNCQSNGMYCGDGVIQKPQEECDLGTQNGIGACSNYCEIITPPTPVPVASTCGNNVLDSGEQCDDGNKNDNDGCSATCTLPPRCGDAKVDSGEQCDAGTLNGTVCTPGYGTSCTYCTNSCTNVTIDAVAYCGNGVVDITWPGFAPYPTEIFEKCDYDSGGVYKLVGENYTKTLQKCDDKGSFVCSNSCQQLQNNCVACGTGQDLPIPKLLVLNPMVQPEKFPQSDYLLNAILYRQNPPPTDPPDGLKILGTRVITHTEYTPFVPYDFSMSPSNSGIETNLACNGEYKISFNKGLGSLSGGGEFGDIQKVGDGQADLFDYPVQAEGVDVVNEVVTSPAVSEDTIRIVTRWEKKTTNSVLFMGEMYQDQLGQTTGNGNTFSYFTNVVPNVGDSNCEEMIQSPFDDYYIPIACDAVDATSNFSGRIWMHKILNQAPTWAVQAITISAQGLASTNPLGFYVTSPNGPINQFTDYDLWVDVYTYHEGQDPAYSIYQPTQSFSIKNAVPSVNSIARYWHVFNLTVDTSGSLKKFIITPVSTNGAIVTNQCEVRRNMPSTTQCELTS